MPDPYDFLDESESPTVLVVDDNLVLVKLVIQTLSPYRMQCHWARSVDEAKLILQAYPVDLVISDIRQPATDGIALAQWIREQASIADTPIMFFTSASDRPTIEAAARVKDIDYLLKPLRPGSFCRRVLRMIGRNRRPEPS